MPLDKDLTQDRHVFVLAAVVGILLGALLTFCAGCMDWMS